MRVPSGLKATDTTPSSCPVRVASSSPDAVSHSRTVLSLGARSDARAVRAEGNGLTREPSCPVRVASSSPDAVVPQPNGLVHGARSDARAVRAEGNGPHVGPRVLSGSRVARPTPPPTAERSCPWTPKRCACRPG